MNIPPGTGAGAAPAPSFNNPGEGKIEKKKNINQELWQACAGPLVNLPAAGTLVVYFPQGHSEQVAASMKRGAGAQIPNYPNLPSKLLCYLNSVTLHADSETDEVYAKMTLQPVASFDKEALLTSELSMKADKPQPEFFCKTLTASDTSTHGGFSVPRRAAEKIFPPLNFTMQPPAQEIVARDLHDNVWTFRHIYRGQPKRHLLTTGWSLFVSGKRLFAGDSVLFIRNEKQELLLGIRRANRPPTNLSSSVLSSDSMHIGILAAAAHANANNSPFSVFYNPRASPTEFVIPLAKYYKAVCSNQISLGMRFRMMFETEDSGTRRYMGTVTGISDLDPVRWNNSQWRNLQVGWDESTAGERRNRVSVWEIEPITTPFFICPTPPLFGSKRPRISGMPDDYSSDLDTILKRTMPWLGDDVYTNIPRALPGLSMVQWMNTQQAPLMAQPNYINPLSGSVLHSFSGPDPARQLGLLPHQTPTQSIQFNAQMMSQQQPQLDQFQNLPSSNFNPLAQISDFTNQTKQNPINQNLSQIMPLNQVPDQHKPPILGHHQPQQQLNPLTQLSTPGTGGVSGVTDDVPSSSTSPSTNNVLVLPVYPTTRGPQMDYVELESISGASVCLSQNNNSMAYNQQSVVFSDTCHQHENIVQFENNNVVGQEKDFSNNLSSGDGLLSNVTQSFGVADVAFGSIDSTINDDSFVNQSGWAPAPQFQRMRTFTKVYKRGAVGRSIDISRYGDYEELKQDLARMFGIEGQLEDRNRVGWKLVYVDHEGDVLLVGDDPWEEFVSCVRCIKILSPQEVRAMSLDGDFGNSVISNQTCSSSGPSGGANL